MLIKRLSSIPHIPTSHSCGLKQVLLFNSETESHITQIAVTELRQGEKANGHSHPDMLEWFFVLGGHLQITVNGIPHICSDGDFIMVDLSEVHELHALTDCRFLSIGCTL